MQNRLSVVSTNLYLDRFHFPQHYLRRTALLLTLALATLVLAACPARLIGFQGRLLDADGNPINGTADFVFDYWTCASGAGAGCSMVFSQARDDVPVVDGLFDTSIGTFDLDSTEAPDPGLFARRMWVEITVNGETLTPRQELFGAPYAMSLAGGAIVISTHAGDTGNPAAEANNYASFSVIAAGTGTALGVNANTNGGDLIRACTGALGGTSTRECSNLRMRLTNTGNLRIDGAVTAGGADFAEHLAATGAATDYEPGDVLVISPDQDRAVALATEPYSTAVIGVYSTDPALLGGGRYLPDSGETEMLPVGIVGIVPVKVSAENGAIRRGDLLTTSSTPGHAMLADEYVAGAILGKAMGELEEGTGVIEVVLLLQ